MATPLELPELPDLRSVAKACERCGAIALILDRKWRAVYMTTEMIDSLGLSDAQARSMLGQSLVVHALAQRIIEMPADSRVRWWESFGPEMRHDVPPEDPDFEAVFGPLAQLAAELEPRDPHAAIAVDRELVMTWAHRLAIPLEVQDLCLRLRAESGELIGVLYLTRPALRDNVLIRLTLGHRPMYEQMLELREPARRPAAILVADLEASSELSRTLSSGAYFRLIRSLTDVIDAEVIVRGGLIGKHAGDGASALFVVGQVEAESRPARAAIEAARAIREAARGLLGGDPPVKVNIGLHWGATLTVGQVSSYGRLEVTALGDEMNEAARIEHVAADGSILVSKALIERLSSKDAADLDLKPETIRFTTIASMGAGGKALRDAASIAVATLV